MKIRVSHIGAFLGLGLMALGTALPSPARSESQTCREWRDEHRDWKVEAIRRYLTGATEREVDMALFELMQREAYLTSCETRVNFGRSELVGWRLVGRIPEQYGSAVLESVLGQAGFDVELTHLFRSTAPAVSSSRPSGAGG